MSTNLSGEGALSYGKTDDERSSIEFQETFLSRRFKDNDTSVFEQSVKVIRDPEFKKYRDSTYEELIENPCKLFNFFVENNDILHKVSQDDEEDIGFQTLVYFRDCLNGSLAGLATTLVLDKGIFTYAYPIPRYPRFRGVIFCGKYLLMPFIGNRIGHWFSPLHGLMRDMTIKYDFGYEDFNWAMDIYETAWKVGLLDELLEQREEFDWNRVNDAQEKR